jgi:hypothetical protein
LANKVDFKDIYNFVCSIIKEVLVEKVLKILFVAENNLARLFTPPPFLFIYRGVNNGNDIFIPVYYSSV